MAEEYQRCPFCGGDRLAVAELESRRIHPRTGREIDVPAGYQVACTTCAARGPKEATPAKAIKEWNRRK